MSEQIKPKKKTYEHVFNIIRSFACIMIFILGMINLVQELPDNISNQTLLLFIIAFGCLAVNKI